MIGYVTLGSNNLAKAVDFYDRLFETINIGRFMEQEGYYVAWAAGPDQPSLAVCKPFDGNSASVGNGVMVALLGKDKEQIDMIYNKALELGGSDEGAPGFRPEGNSGYYAGYFRDLDGNKLNIFCMIEEK